MVAGVLCWAAGFGLLVAIGSWSALCLDGTFDRCLNGSPSFELVFQAVLAGAGFAATIVMWLLVRSRPSYRPSVIAAVIAVVLFAAWAIVLDAATHGWDDLQVPIRLLTVAVIVAPLLIVAAVLRRLR
jgi:hypothetical protein